jgi:hypothetical protein
MKQEFPKWLYKDGEAPVIVHNEDERDALGEGWAESPAEAATLTKSKKK